MFALLGDVPYSQPHANLLDAMIDRINREKPAFVVHVGDIGLRRMEVATHGNTRGDDTVAVEFPTVHILIPAALEFGDRKSVV